MRAVERKILTRAEFTAERERLRAAGLRLAQCHGCFDIVHPGHLRYLAFARRQGDRLLVTVSADDVVRKGFDRPYVTEALRMENLAALEHVDYVLLDHGEDATGVLEFTRPDVYVKGKEYEEVSDPRLIREVKVVESYGGDVVFSSGDVVFSSTELIRRFGTRFGSTSRDRVAAHLARHGIDRDALFRGIRRAGDRKVLVVADLIVDRYVYCDAPRVAAETPMLSVTAIDERRFAGGGALVALQLLHLGLDVEFLTVAEPGTEVEWAAERIRAAGGTFSLIEMPARTAFSKSRYVAGNQKLLKVDTGLHSPVSHKAGLELARRVREAAGKVDAIAAIDFGYGLLNADVTDACSDVARQSDTGVFVDVSGDRGGANLLRVHAARCATPTEAELRSALTGDAAGLSNLASRYFEATGAEFLVVTLGERGCVSFRNVDTERLPAEYLPSLATTFVDGVGAGDVLLAGVIASDVAGLAPGAGLFVGSLLAANHVGTLGNAPQPLDDLLAYAEDVIRGVSTT